MDQAQQLRNIIKSNQQLTNQTARVITVTSGKGGVGKTNVSINLAVQFRKMGKRVIIFDADFGLANIEVMFGAVPKYNLADLIYKGKTIKEIITVGPMDIGFISGGSGVSGLNNISRDRVLALIKHLRELDNLADIIIVDTGAGISDNVMDFVMASREVILVTTQEPTSLTDSYSLLKTMKSSNDFFQDKTTVKLLANRVFSSEDGKNLYSKLNTVVNRFLDFEIEFLGTIPYDDNVLKAVINQKPVSMANPNSKASKAFEEIAYLMIEGEQAVPKGQGLAGLFSKFLKNTRS